MIEKTDFIFFIRGAALPFLGALIAISAWMISSSVPAEWSSEIWGLLQHTEPQYIVVVVILLGAIEASFPICHYIPGTIIYAGIVGAHVGGLPVVGYSITATTGVFIGLVSSYLLGRFVSNAWILRPYGSYLMKLRNLSPKYGNGLVVLTSIHPNNIAALYVVYGLLKEKFLKNIILAVFCTFFYITAATWIIYGVAQSIHVSAGVFQLFLGVGLFALGIVLGVRSLRASKAKK